MPSPTTETGLRRTAGSPGFTMAELLIAMVFGLIVMGTLYSFYRQQLFTLLTQETKTATLEEARGGLEMMVRELRNAGSWTKSPYTAPTGCERVRTADVHEVHIQADLGTSGNCATETGDYVGYSLSSSTTCTTSSPCDIRRHGSVTDTGESLVSNVVIPSTFVKYYEAGGGELTGVPLSAADRAKIKRIKITFQVREQNPDPKSRSTDPYVSSTLTSSVELRN